MQALQKVVDGTHVLVTLMGDHDYDDRTIIVPIETWETWKEAIKAAEDAGDGGWPDHITKSVHAAMHDQTNMVPLRMLITTGGMEGIIDGEDQHYIS